MKLLRVLAFLLLTGLFTSGGGSTAMAAAECWATDPSTGCQICWVSDSWTLASVKWNGPVVNGKAEGHGTLTFIIRNANDGKQVPGTADAEMKAGKMDGKVSIKWLDGDSFDGYYKEGVFEGHGVFQFASGSSYDGEFKNGLRDGRGTYRGADGKTYEGDWTGDKMNGKGVFKWSNGNVYEGDFIDGQSDGYGIQHYANGDVYTGEWKADQRNGKGIFVLADGRRYEGDWAGDEKAGKGVFRWPDGEVYEGDFANDGRSGYGIQKDATGKVLYQGLWKDDKQAQPQVAVNPVACGTTVGSKLAPLSLPLLNGRAITLAPESDKVLIINFFASWCPYCVKEMPEFNEFYLRNSDKVKMYVVDMWEEPSAGKAFMNDCSYSIPTVYDNTNGRLEKDFKIDGVPVTLIVDRNGIIQYRSAGMMPPGKLAEEVNKVLRSF